MMNAVLSSLPLDAACDQFTTRRLMCALVVTPQSPRSHPVVTLVIPQSSRSHRVVSIAACLLACMPARPRRYTGRTITRLLHFLTTALSNDCAY